MDKCKYCKQEASFCICTKVDRYFNENWYLMYIWHDRKKVQFAYAFPRDKKAA